MATIGQLKDQGYTHVEARCYGCRRTVLVPFRMIGTVDYATIEDLGKRMRCEKCGGPAEDVKPWRQSDSPGYYS